MRDGFRKSFGAWLEGARKVGFVLALAAGSAALGLVIAWPLWLFATSARRAYTIAVVCLAGAGVVFLIVRAVQRRRRSTRDAGRRSILAVILTVAMALIGAAGAFVAAALFVRGLWIIGGAAVVLWGGMLWLLARARRAAKVRKARPIPAENMST